MNAETEKEFMASLDEKELMAYNIAKSHLGTMFSLEKSNAFIEWLKKKSPLCFFMLSCLVPWIVYRVNGVDGLGQGYVIGTIMSLALWFTVGKKYANV
jgi:hypothetical protein